MPARVRRAPPRGWLARLALCWAIGAGLAVGIGGCGGSHSNPPRADRQPIRETSDVVRGPLGNLHLWVDPGTPAALQEAAWRKLGDRRAAAEISRIAREPTADWLTSSLGTSHEASELVHAAARAGDVAQLVLYDIPDRDCHSYSAGGASSPAAYLAWVSQVTAAIGRTPVVVIVEPDAIDQAASGSCLSPSAATARYQLIAQAVGRLRADPNAHVYIDAGHVGWLSASQIAQPLRAAGIAHASGFSLDVANFQTTRASIGYGDALSKMLGGAHFVIDTSRNGNGPPPTSSAIATWCNPPGRRIGRAPTVNTGVPKVDAFLWVKYPGESDGDCGHGAPPAGSWWPAYAISLVGGHLPARAAAAGAGPILRPTG